MKKTKEELLIENTKLQKEVEEWANASKRRLGEFAKALNRFKPHSGYYPGERLPEDMSWEQVFVELGKLLAARNFMDFEGNISELECKLEDIIKKIKSEIHPNF